MEDITLNGFQLLTTYGPLGVITMYFVYKDMILNKAMTDALNKFTLAMNLLTNGKVGE
ncbi:MAG: hypothetical protein AB9836_03495 [Aminipila sp.]